MKSNIFLQREALKKCFEIIVHPTCHAYMCADVVVVQVRLPPEVNRILYIKNLPYKITAEEMYDIFGKYGAIRQIRVWEESYAENTYCL